MVMLHILLRIYGKNVAVAHCNFGLRGSEADIETNMVVDYCKSQSVECFVARFNTLAQMTDGESIQMAARRLRYDFFEKIANDNRFDKISIAHNFDDKIETFLINLTRGAGTRGLKGMSVKNGLIVRPLLGVTRCEIERYAADNKVVYMNDSSNNEEKYLRNKIRHSIVPIFRECCSFDVAMESVFDNLASENDFLESKVVLELHNFSLEAADNYALFRYLEQFGFSSDISAQLYKSHKSGLSGKRFYSPSHVALIHKDELVVEPLNTEFDLPKFERAVEPFDASKSYVATDNVAYFDAKSVADNLMVRHPQNGDFFVPYGMNGRKLLSDFFKDSNVNILDRPKKCILASRDNIIWVVGMRTDDRFKVTHNTEKVLKITVTFSL